MPKDIKREPKRAEFYEDIVRDVISDFKKRREARKSFELQWRLNMNFFIGNQFSEITPDGDIDDAGRLYYWQEREVFNHIAPIIETRLAKLSALKPNVNIRPATGFDDDINTAKFASRILSSVFSRAEIETLINQAAMWAELCGTCFYKIGWNQNKGAPSGQNGDGEYIYDGEVEITVCPPFEIFPDNCNAGDIKSLKSIIHAKVYTVDEIKEIWGVDASPEDADLAADYAPDASGVGYTVGISKTTAKKPENCAYVIERYTAPGKKYPEGNLT
ncbi:MAG: hypothetical protein LBQ40_00170, partial [Clostridiales bacterium]|nr:hypothetical protein [Clostridiales bacterium]